MNLSKFKTYRIVPVLALGLLVSSCSDENPINPNVTPEANQVTFSATATAPNTKTASTRVGMNKGQWQGGSNYAEDVLFWEKEDQLSFDFNNNGTANVETFEVSRAEGQFADLTGTPPAEGTYTIHSKPRGLTTK